MSDPDLTGMDPQMRRFLAMISLGAADARHVTPNERRRSFEKLMRLSKRPAAAVSAVDRVIQCRDGAIPIRIYTPGSADPNRSGLVYFHGGGLVAGDLDTHDALCRTLAHEACCHIVAIGYRLAPEHPFPEPIIDALVAVRWVLRQAEALGIAGDRIGVGGDSGGATLAAIAGQVFRRRLKAQVLLCPFLDLAGTHASRQAFANGFLLDEATMTRDLVHYDPRRSLDDPSISPLRARSLVGMPSTIIHTAGFDPLRDEGAAYAARLQAAGVEVRHTCHDALAHHFYALTSVVPAAAIALSAIAEDIRSALMSPPKGPITSP
jgi:acetyl esterase/lipase